MILKMKTGVTLIMGLMMGTAVNSYSPYGREDECYKEIGKGLRIEADHVDKYVRAGSLKDCERSCDIAFFSCKSFSYSEFHTREPENCLLSREDTHNLDLDDPRDFYEDRDFLYFEKTSGRDCEYEADHHRGDVCYELIKTRERIDSRYVRKVLRTRDRQECEDECTANRECRGFNYRFKTAGFNQYRDNCELSDRGTGDKYDFKYDEDFDFYEQISGSRCRSSGSSSSSSSIHRPSTGSGGYGARDECFKLTEAYTKIENRLIKESVEVRDIRECETECANSRYFTCRSFAFSYGGASYSNRRNRENCFLSDREYREMNNYDLVFDRESDFYERRMYDRECGIDYEDNSIQYGGDVTVSGTRCYRDRCREDREGGYFYCETDFSGAWDYCCRPDEVCGFSEGMQVKWCYVGIQGRDQWRPCTDQGPGREYLKAELPRFVNVSGLAGSPGDNSTNVEVYNLNDILD